MENKISYSESVSYNRKGRETSKATQRTRKQPVFVFPELN